VHRSEIGIDFTDRAYNGHPKTAIVVFIDVLGIKGIWKRCKPIEIVNKWKKVIGSFRNVLEEGSLSAGYFFRILSDTIIITIPAELNQSTINRTFDLLIQPFIDSIKTGLLLRGIVSNCTILNPIPVLANTSMISESFMKSIIH
jgi:hypothetical protein